MRISVCIATYNGEKYLREQLESILIQLSENDEIIISDDFSSDHTLDLINSLNDKRIKLYKNRQKRNATFNFENSLRNAKGDLIFLADQDDIWHPDKVSVLTRYLEKYYLVVSDCYVVDSDKNTIFESYFSLLNSGKGFIKNIVKNSYLGCCMAFQKELLDVALPFPKNLIGHDIWLGCLAEKYGEVIFIDQKLLYYRRHSNNVSFAAGKSRNSLYFKIKYRLVFILYFFFRISFKI